MTLAQAAAPLAQAAAPLAETMNWPTAFAIVGLAACVAYAFGKLVGS